MKLSAYLWLSLFSLTSFAETLKVTIKDVLDLAYENTVAEQTTGVHSIEQGKTVIQLKNFSGVRPGQSIRYQIFHKKIERNEVHAKITFAFMDPHQAVSVLPDTQSLLVTRQRSERSFSYWHGRQLIRQKVILQLVD